MWGGIFNLAVEGLGKYTAAASGIFMVMVCGGGIVPLIQGFVADKAGYLASYWVMFACIGYMLFFALIGSKNVNKDIPVEVIGYKFYGDVQEGGFRAYIDQDACISCSACA